MRKKKKPSFGVHLMLEIYNCPSAILNNANVLYKILDELPGKIGMTKMTLPYVVFTPGNNKKDPGGWSGFVLIQESHISFHTFAKRRFVTIDVYSCKDFESDMAISYLKKAFRSKDIEYKIEARGSRYPEENLE